MAEVPYVFISYSRRDHAAARQIVAVLRRYSPFMNVWMDESIEGGERYARRIYEELDRSHVFLALVSDAWRDSSWCTREAEWALSRADDTGNLRIIPLALTPDFKLDGSPLYRFQAVDLTRWRFEADTILQESVIALG